MVFKRRDRLPLGQRVKENIWPRRGWLRAIQYLNHRLRRLPDPPHRIARGIFAGVWVSFTPLFGLHFGVAAALAWLIRGNIVASLIGTLIGNPLTFPFIATLSIELGNWILGHGGEMDAMRIFFAFGQAGAELSANFWAIFTSDDMQWRHWHRFVDRVFWPYFIGGIVPGLVAGLVCYYLTLPVVSAYQKVRRKRLTERFDRLRAARAAAQQPAADPAVPDGGDAGGGTA